MAKTCQVVFKLGLLHASFPSHFLDQIIYICQFSSLMLPNHPTPAMVPLYFPAFCNYSRIRTCIWILELRASNERELVTFVFLDPVTSLNLIFPSSIHLPEKFVISFFIYS